MISIPGGELLLHPQIDEIVKGLVERKKYVYLCTNGLLLGKGLHKFQTSLYLSFSVNCIKSIENPTAKLWLSFLRNYNIVGVTH